MSEQAQFAVLINLQSLTRQIVDLLRPIRDAVLQLANIMRKFASDFTSRMKEYYPKDIELLTNPNKDISSDADLMIEAIMRALGTRGNVDENLEPSYPPGFGQGGRSFGGFAQGINLGDISFKALGSALSKSLGKTFKKMGKGIKDVFGGVGKQLMASFSPMMLLFQILSPMVEAFLEPLDMLQPLLQSWGTILSQLLIPIVLALMDILMPFTPLLTQIVDILMPIIDLIPMLVQIFLPFIEIMVTLLGVGINLIGVFTELIFGGLGPVGEAVAQVTGWISDFVTAIPQKFGEFFNWIREFIDNLWDQIIGSIRGFGQKIRDAWTDMIDGIFDNIKDKFTIFDGGGLDNNTETWW